MLDIKLIRDQPETVRSNLIKRGATEMLQLLNEVIRLDKEWRQLLTESNKLRHKRRKVTNNIAVLKKKGEDISQLVQEAKGIPEKIKQLENKINENWERIRYILMKLPNILHESVPVGEDASNNFLIRKWGKIPEFDFSVKDHIDLGLALGILDIERAAKISGTRFQILKKEAVLLDLALMNFALEELRKKGYVPVEPPFMIKKKPYEGVTDLGDFEEMLYKIEDEDLYLIATSEHPMGSMHMDEILIEKNLPLKYTGISACFRKEAGAHGKDTRGIFRTHQFNKIEQFIFCKPEDSWKMHEELIKNAEELFQKIGLPYRIVSVCTGDIGSVAAKKYDLEAWMPAQNDYREVVSCSNCTDYQSRRLNVRYREKEGMPPKGFVHTLNSTAIATGRTIVAILENYQQRDGSVVVPPILREFMGGIERIG
jgi:seryl-tRNA synthetase